MGMHVGKSMTVAAAEDMLSATARALDDRARIPTRSQHHQAGGEPAMVQALVTWAQAVDRPTLQTWVPNEDDPDNQLGTLTRQFFGLSAALLCDDAFAIDGASVFTDLRTKALDRLELLQGENMRAASRGPQFELLCADHLAKAAPSLLYDRDAEGQPTLKHPESFMLVASKIRTTVIPYELPRTPAARFDNALGGALYELFRNTEEHARFDDVGDKLGRSLRGIQARRHSIAPTKLRELVAGSPPLADFCERLRPLRATNLQIQLIEVSVLDSGPGYAASITGRPLASLTLEEEARAVRDCFMKHATRKEHARSGLGLCNVVDILRDHGGFLRLRTGRQSLYADLSFERDAAYGTPPDLREWPVADDGPAQAAGSLMTLLLPIVLDA